MRILRASRFRPRSHSKAERAYKTERRLLALRRRKHPARRVLRDSEAPIVTGVQGRARRDRRARLRLRRPDRLTVQLPWHPPHNWHQVRKYNGMRKKSEEDRRKELISSGGEEEGMD
jgi:hypothetical protein